jgi:hypothetical protein
MKYGGNRVDFRGYIMAIWWYFGGEMVAKKRTDQPSGRIGQVVVYFAVAGSEDRGLNAGFSPAGSTLPAILRNGLAQAVVAHDGREGKYSHRRRGRYAAQYDGDGLGSIQQICAEAGDQPPYGQ